MFRVGAGVITALAVLAIGWQVSAQTGSPVATPSASTTTAVPAPAMAEAADRLLKQMERRSWRQKILVRRQDSDDLRSRRSAHGRHVRKMEAL